MTHAEAIAAIKANWPTENYTMLREALTLACAALASPPIEGAAAVYRAVLEGAGYERLDDLPAHGVEFARMLGETARMHTLALTVAPERLKDVADKLMALPVEESVGWHCDVIPRQQALRIVYDAVCPLRTPTADDEAWARSVLGVAYPPPAPPQAEEG